ncbi:MAG: hypothetical protein EP330_12280 [Deltaproteobacteria bacterium]|nr:MAG: hypothetical protein EP330_12280 [Deltaproteobacteria bacterium]
MSDQPAFTPGNAFAWISPKRGLFLASADGQVYDPALPVDTMRWGSFSVTATQTASFSWPTWSPDGRWLAVFRLPSEHSRARLFTIEQGGVRSTELGELGDRIPIYLYWSPSGRRIATLCQAGNDLELSCFDTESLGRQIALASGTPLFFTWADREVLAFVGTNQGQTRLELFDPRAAGHSTVFPGQPGNFCAPLWMDDRAVYVLHEGGETWLSTAGSSDSEPHKLERVHGLVAMLPSPKGEWLARAVAPDGDGTPYRDLSLVSVRTGEVRPIADTSCLAFVWSPSGDALITARVDTDRNLIVWSRLDIDSGEELELAALYPTRDLGFYLRFFEQYAQSHQLVSSDGKHLLLAGGLDDAPDPDRPRIWQIATDGSGIDEIDEGLFAVYAPRPTDG